MGIYLGFRHQFQRSPDIIQGEWWDLSRKSVTFPQTLLAKLDESNRRDLGSQRQQGTVFVTPVDSDILTIVNAYLHTGLTAKELRLILSNRAQFEFRIGVGDRRNGTSLIQRFAVVQNWAGEDVSQRVLTPEAFTTQPYRHALTFSGATGRITVTDTHSGNNRFGSVRYLIIRYRD